MPMADDDTPYEVIGAEYAVPDKHGHVIVQLQMKGDPLLLAFSIDQLAPMVALISQAANQAYAIAGNAPQLILETADTQVFREDQQVDIHFRLVDGLDLPICLSLQKAHDLHDKLAASLARGSVPRSGPLQ
jgi:hypothetical protein